MNIAVICNYSLKPERIGGMDRFFIAFDQACKARGFQVDWYFSNCRTHNFYVDLKIFASENTSAEVEFLKHSDTWKYQVLVTHFVELCTPLFKKIKKNHRAYIIAVDHNPRPLHGFTLKKKIKNKIKGILYSPYINKIICVSQYSKNAVLKDFGGFLQKKITIINNGIETELYNSKVVYSNPASKFITTSHLRKEKGIQDIIIAVSNIKDLRNFNFHIDIYGEGEYKTELLNLVTELKLESYFRFMGSVPDLYKIYATYDYLIQPSHGETFCFSIVESLVSGLPIITTIERGNVLGLVKPGKNGYLYHVDKIDELSLILKKIITGEYCITNFIDNELIAQRYHLNRMVNDYVKLLDNI